MAAGTCRNLKGQVFFLLFLFIPLAGFTAVYYFGVDVPSTLQGTTYTTNDIVESLAGNYSKALFLPSNIPIGSLARETSSRWQFSPAEPIKVGSSTYFEPRDILVFNGMSVGMILDGGGLGIPDKARIDALFFNSSGYHVVSFDVPVNLGGTEYSQNDLLVYSGSWNLYWDGDGAGIPPSSNVVGAELDPFGDLVLTFDVPTTIGDVTFLPGQLVWVHDGSFYSYFVDPDWPAGTQLRDFAFGVASGAGEVPERDGLAGTPLMVTKSSTIPGWLHLSWGGSCLSSDKDYAVYAGNLNSYPSHMPVVCTTSGNLTTDVSSPRGDSYILILPLTDIREGAYGFESSGDPRPASIDPCLPQQVTACP
ncbi:MAG TPA: hypothetical protein PK014_14380 [Thermoanaerobaculia bacterium]|nr:hypothetical protein [Thermoanaerobaculia bacterium]HUM31236.1 hypothetical protein [Thermoanaerobaculia bacterium]HXK69590.1 hypothetical protein [Thermoanaerobaculia bacterium]